MPFVLAHFPFVLYEHLCVMLMTGACGPATIAGVPVLIPCHGVMQFSDICLPCLNCKTIIFTRGQFWPSGIVVACVCVCVHVCVSLCVNHLVVHTITRDPFKLGSPKLDQIKMQKTLVKVPIVLGGN